MKRAMPVGTVFGAILGAVIGYRFETFKDKIELWSPFLSVICAVLWFLCFASLTWKGFKIGIILGIFCLIFVYIGFFKSSKG